MYPDDDEEVTFTKAEVRAMMDELWAIRSETATVGYDWGMPSVAAKAGKLAWKLKDKLGARNESSRAEDGKETGL